MKKRFLPRIKEAEEKELLNEEGNNFSPEKIWKVLMRNEKPGGHGERSTAVGTIDMAVWDIVSKIEKVPLYEHLAKKYGDGKFTNKIFIYAAGGYYYPGKDIQMLQDEMKSYLDLGISTVKMKIGGAPLKDDLKRIENSFLIIAGKLDKMTPLKSSSFLNSKLKKSHLEIISDCGHFHIHERSGKVRWLIDKFIES